MTDINTSARTKIERDIAAFIAGGGTIKNGDNRGQIDLEIAHVRTSNAITASNKRKRLKDLLAKRDSV